MSLYDEGYEQAVTDVEEGRDFNSFPPPGISPYNKSYQGGYRAGWKAANRGGSRKDDIPWEWVVGGVAVIGLFIVISRAVAKQPTST